MTTRKGHLRAELGQSSEVLPSGLVDLLNSNIKPPRPVIESEIEIRAMYVVSNQVNSFGGRFPDEERRRLAELLVDSPVLVGHRKDKLPVARTFHATLVERDGIPWVKAYFYWSRSAEGSDDLKNNIDGGIYKECSVAFTFQLPECSICGHDIRECPHEPFREYRQGGGNVPCYFDYRGIEKVLETSLVYRGAVPGTSITRDLQHGRQPALLLSPSYLDSQADYLITPSYEGLPVELGEDEQQVVFTDACNETINTSWLDHDLLDQLRQHGIDCGLLVGYRGKERRRRTELLAYLNGENGPVTRAVLHYLPPANCHGTIRFTSDKIQIKQFPHRISKPADLNRAALEIKSRDGVNVVSAGDSYRGRPVYRYYPDQALTESRCEYTLSRSPGATEILLRLRHGHTHLDYRLLSTDTDDISGLQRFVAEHLTGSPHNLRRDTSEQATGKLIELKSENGTISFEVAGKLHGRFVGRPVKIKNDEYMLFSTVSQPWQNHHSKRAVSAGAAT